MMCYSLESFGSSRCIPFVGVSDLDLSLADNF